MENSTFIGKVRMEYESLVSTNEYAWSLLQQQNLLEGTLIRADVQTGGKGYGNNTWESEKSKNLLTSIILKPVFLQAKRSFFLNQIISLAVADTITKLLQKSDAAIKWPNDILVGEKKIAGILIENSVQGNLILNTIAGIGININQSDFGQSLKHATSLFRITGKENSLKNVLDLLCSNIEHRYLQLRNNQIDRIQKDYMKILFRVEEESMYKADGKLFKGKITGLTAEGKLILEVNQQHEIFGFKEVEMML